MLIHLLRPPPHPQHPPELSSVTNVSADLHEEPIDGLSGGRVLQEPTHEDTCNGGREQRLICRLQARDKERLGTTSSSGSFTADWEHWETPVAAEEDLTCRQRRDHVIVGVCIRGIVELQL